MWSRGLESTGGRNLVDILRQVFEEGMAPPGSEDVGACMIPM